MADSETLVQKPDKLFIDGKWTTAVSDAKIDVRDSHSEEVFLSVAEAQIDDVEAAIFAARTAFDKGPWSRMSPEERAEYLLKFADAWDKRITTYANAWTREAGVLNGLAQMMVGVFSASLRNYVEVGKTFQWIERHQPAHAGFGALVREPAGVVAAILPWNAPAHIAAHKVPPALLAGCTMVLKGSPEAPVMPYLIAEIAEEIGLPPGVINVLTADREVSEHLVRHPAIDKVSFTGSTAAGRRIASICGDRMARVTLELGGKSPAIILDDYDLETAAQSLAQAGRIQSGQVCASLTRIIVSKQRHDQLVDALASAFGQTKVGDPFDPATQMGPLAMARQRDRVESLMNQARAEGAQLAVGGGRPADLPCGYYIEPTVFANVDNDNIIAREEIFGPVLSVIPAENEQQAIDIANDTIYGLNASVFTNDADKAFDVARQIRSGTVGHNRLTGDFNIAFGGFKQSGIGREGGVDGLRSYTEAKTVLLDGVPSRFA